MRVHFVRWCFLTALVAGCQSHAATCKSDPGIAAAQAAWKARHLDNYKFVWHQTCFCLPQAVQPIVVTVRHGAIVSATDLGGAAIADDVKANLMTIDELYRHLEDMKCTADEVQLTASADGVPEKIYIDPRHSIADDEFDISISQLTATGP